ncbi:ribonuclease P protein component [Mycoplasma sp. CSL10137]|uniref:ribonuclease P protein component n=1 Tax=unclassified Mycoplasma TaxID=2683645 RepID=UPI00197C11A2|nr:MULTISPECIES: ribonuclease P protein component [unclassified Mycoplasma]MBN4083613.1 ribonuclease P protein component [Mycoplasma sp. CSL10137]MBN4084105.1 ribonuclease P protein component [Mycoplasma sp. CSL10166]MBU4693198.1 ribonuclease P protein component [Mycoplasma sp. CSL7491-lung]MCU4706546.1 ribonuclease P protein component [Mycoplasma sp. CSL7503-lung]
MKKIYRLKKNWDFQEIISKNNSLHNKYIVLYYKKSNSFKMGITIPKKFENAVGRNFNKRQLKAIINNLNPYDLNYDFVIIARKEFCNSPFSIKKVEIQKLFERFRKNEK